MYNGFHLPNNNLNVQVFLPIGGTIQPWRKPAGAKLIHIVCIGGGAGGGGGFTRASGVAGGGGGGGGSSAITRMTIDASLCPDMLYIAVGMGGDGSTGAGGAGGISYVYMPLTSGFTYAGTVLLQSSASAPTGGGVGTVAVGGAAGAAGIIAVSPTWGSLGTWTSIAGQAGIIGGAITAVKPTAVAWGTLFISGGAGGGGVTTGNTASAGGDVNQATGNSIVPTIVGGVSGGGDGGQGVDLFGKPPLSTGGAGGGAFGTGVGGRGGDGGFGSGGGGGGAGTTGGRGGDGGNGRVIITCI